MLSLSSAPMNRVVPSSKLRAILCGTRLPDPPSSDVIHVDDVADVVVLQNHLFGLDQGAFTCDCEHVEGNSEIGIDDFVPINVRQPVEAYPDCAVALW